MSEQNPVPDGTEQPGSPAQPPSGSVYESGNYQTPPAEPPPPPPPPPIAGGPPPGYEHAYPPPGAYAAPAAKNNTQLFGILGIVLAVVCCPLLGILFGWLSINEAKKTGSDATLGKVGLWLGVGLLALSVVVGIIAACAGAFGSWNNNY
jgi:hypothetical protein